VLQTIPASEQQFHGNFIQPLVESALVVLRDEYQIRGGEWCLPRRVHVDDTLHQLNVSTQPAGRKRHNEDISEIGHEAGGPGDDQPSRAIPPVILSSTAINSFESASELNGSIVKNLSSERVTLAIRSSSRHDCHIYNEYIIPPYANFILCTLPISQPERSHPTKITALTHPIPAILQGQKFNLLLFDPPWPNRSVRRSKHYQINDYSEMAILTQRLRDILRAHAYHTGDALLEKSAIDPSQHGRDVQSRVSLAAIWITNAEKARRAAYDALTSTGFRIAEEWVWVKTTVDGQPTSAVDGLWRKPYEILVIGQADYNGGTVHSRLAATNEDSILQGDDLLGIDPAGIKRRIIAAVPDLHSRKPNLKEIFERVFFMEGHGNESSESDEMHARVQSYSAMEVFARNLIAGWWSCGNEVLKFNASECWVDE
jgi:N6-adenosine-specific RNA methylase IME4